MFDCIEMLLTNCRTCRIAPRMARYFGEHSKPEKLTKTCKDGEVSGLVVPLEGCIDCDELFTQLVFAWKKRNWNQVAAYFTVAASVIAVEGCMRDLTAKGLGCLLEKNQQQERRKPDFCLLLISLLYKNTSEDDDEDNNNNNNNKQMKTYLFACYRTVVQFTEQKNKERVFVAMVFSILARSIYRDTELVLLLPPPPPPSPTPSQSSRRSSSSSSSTHWNSFSDTIDRIPDWAVDLETYRGLTGVGVPNVGRNYIHEFYGNRPKKFMEDYLEESFVCTEKAVVVPENEFDKDCCFHTQRKTGQPANYFINQVVYRKMLTEKNKDLVIAGSNNNDNDDNKELSFYSAKEKRDKHKCYFSEQQKKMNSSSSKSSSSSSSSSTPMILC